ncbi:hypothetical protein HHK36_005097 [Tetracentron sinense]|uniref:Uncharacterized protein n=1 Tax=Tetracentron sinense TaxID=13715 RepID=A0A834ZKB4_TETSI|nr:hypothetical protein HHK36_005097 [Tetracentron sinense]
MPPLLIDFLPLKLMKKSTMNSKQQQQQQKKRQMIESNHPTCYQKVLLHGRGKKVGMPPCYIGMYYSLDHEHQFMKPGIEEKSGDNNTGTVDYMLNNPPPQQLPSVFCGSISLDRLSFPEVLQFADFRPKFALNQANTRKERMKKLECPRTHRCSTIILKEAFRSARPQKQRAGVRGQDLSRLLRSLRAKELFWDILVSIELFLGG